MVKFDDGQRKKLNELIASIKIAISKHGAAHGAWDNVSNYEEVLAGRSTMFSFSTATEWIEHAQKCLDSVIDGG